MKCIFWQCFLEVFFENFLLVHVIKPNLLLLITICYEKHTWFLPVDVHDSRVSWSSRGLVGVHDRWAEITELSELSEILETTEFRTIQKSRNFNIILICM